MRLITSSNKKIGVYSKYGPKKFIIKQNYDDSTEKSVVQNRYFLGRKCVFCDKCGLYRLADKRVKCKKKYSLSYLKKEMEILYYFYIGVSARKTTKELDLDYGVIHRNFMQFMEKIVEYCNQEARKLNGELELDESYFEWNRKGNRGRGANNKAIAFGILERKGKVHTIIVENVKADTFMQAIESKTKKMICILHRWI